MHLSVTMPFTILKTYFVTGNGPQRDDLHDMAGHEDTGSGEGNL